jgi:hypothetical protein
VNKQLGFFTGLAYSLTYINQVVWACYFILDIFGKTDGIFRSDGGVFTAIVICIVSPLLCQLCLYCRYRFDLMRMHDGTSHASRMIWNILNLLMNVVLVHLFLRDVLTWY